MPGIIKIYRADDQPFSQIPNEAIRDPRITPTAFRLLAYLMSHQDGYELLYTQIERQTGMGEYAITSAIKTLEELGWLRTDRPRENGKFLAKTYTILNPATRDDSSMESSQMVQSRDLKKNTKTENTNIKNLAHSENERLFDEFWKIYPRKVAKATARKSFIRRQNKDEIIEGAKRLAADPNLPETQFIPHPATWLNREGWLDDPYPPKEAKTEEEHSEWGGLKWLN